MALCNQFMHTLCAIKRIYAHTVCNQENLCTHCVQSREIMHTLCVQQENSCTHCVCNQENLCTHCVQSTEFMHTLCVQSRKFIHTLCVQSRKFMHTVCALGCFSKDTLKKNKMSTPPHNWGVPRKIISRRRGWSNKSRGLALALKVWQNRRRFSASGGTYMAPEWAKMSYNHVLHTREVL